MAGGWGSKKNGVRIGVFWDSIQLNSDGSKARITDPRVAIDRDQNIVDSTNKLSVSGGAVVDGSWSNINVSGSGEERVKNVSASWVTLKYGETVSASFSASMSGIDYAGGTLSESRSVTYPARSYGLPAAPTALRVIRNSDTSHSLTWTNNGSTEAPYGTIHVERSENGGSTWSVVYTSSGETAPTNWTDTGTVANKRYNWRVRAQNSAGYSGYVTSSQVGTTPTAPSACTATRISDAQTDLTWTNNTAIASNVLIERWDNVSNTWQQIVTLASTATSYANTSTVANRRYQYRVRAVNLGIYSAYATSGYVVTTPAAPSAIATSKSGTSITITWTNNASYATNVYIEHLEGAGSWVAEATLAAGATSYTDTGVNTAATHQYRVRAYNGLYSGYVTSGVVQLLTPPAAPTVSVSKAVADFNTDTVTVSWVHNSLDSTVQTAADVRTSIAGSGNWNIWLVTPGTAANRVLSTTNELYNGNTYEIQVRTKGGHATYGPWSSSVLVLGSSTPSVTIETPVDESVIEDSSVLTLEWAYNDPEGTPQQAWYARLLKSGYAVEEHSGTTETSYVFTTPLANDSTYTVDIKVQDGSGLWSNLATSTFTTDFLDPVAPTLELTFDPDNGYVEVSINTPAAGEDELDAEYVDLYRVNVFDHTRGDGRTLTLIGSQLPPNSTYIDRIPVIGSNDGSNGYLAVSWSSVPTSREMEEVNLWTDTSTPYVFLNGGPGFETVARLKANPAVEMAIGREKVLHHFAGRAKPIEFTGDALSRVFKLSGEIDGYDGGHESSKFEQIAYLPAPIVYRDPIGRRAFCSISDVVIGHDARNTRATISCTLTEIDYDE